MLVYCALKDCLEVIAFRFGALSHFPFCSFLFLNKALTFHFHI